MKKKKICFVVSSPSSARWFFRDHMENLSSKYEVHLVANFNDPKNDLEGFVIDGYKDIKIERRLSFRKDVKSLFQLIVYFKEMKFDVIHTMASKPSLLAAIAGFFVRVPIRIRIFTGQLWCNMKGVKRLLFKTIDKLTVSLNTVSMADGSSQMDYLVQQGIVKKGQGIVLANGSICGVDTNRFSFDADIRERYRRELNLINKTVYIFVGRHKTEKGVNELLEAFSNLYFNHNDSVLLFVGTDEEGCKERLSAYNNLVDGENVIFYGATRTPEYLLMAADVFCLPSYREGFGLSVLEASCIGLPVICSDVYGMKDTMINNKTGLRCKVRDSQSLEKCMDLLYNDASLRKSMGEYGHKMVVDKFSKELVISEWFKFYSNLLD